MKKLFFDICYIATIIPSAIFIKSCITFDADPFFFLVADSKTMIFRVITVPLILSLWIKCIHVWSKNDKKTSQIILLILLLPYYVIFYYPKIRRRNWI